MTKTSVKIIIAAVLLAGIAAIVVLFGFQETPEVRFSTQNRIVSPEKDFFVSLDSEGDIRVGGSPSIDYDFSGWDDIVSLAAGYEIVAGIRDNGTVAITGSNYNEKDKVGDWTDIVMVSMSLSATFGLKEDGTVVCAGGDLGNGLLDMTRVRSEIAGWENIKYIDAGELAVAGVKEDGTVVMIATTPQLEQEVNSWTDIVCISTAQDRAVGIKTSGEVVVCEVTAADQVLTAYPYSDFEGAVKVVAGSDVMACLMPDGKVKVKSGLETAQKMTQIDSTWFSLQHGIVEGARSVVDIACMKDTVAALKASGEIAVN